MMGPGMAAIDHIEGRIAFLRAELNITEAQTTAWNAFADALRTNAKKLAQVRASMMPQPGAGQQQVPTIAERFDMQERWLLARLDGESSGTSDVRCRPMPGTSAMRSRPICARCCRSRDRLRARRRGVSFSWDVPWPSSYRCRLLALSRHAGMSALCLLSGGGFNRSTQHPSTLIWHVEMACIWREMRGPGSRQS